MSWTGALQSWTRRKIKFVNGTSAGVQPNYQLKISIHKGSGSDGPTDVFCGGNCRDDFGDIRFTDSDGSTLLYYWIESITTDIYGSPMAGIFVNVPNLPLGPSGKNIYIYYNNPSATTTSNYTSVFAYATGGDITYDGNYTIHTFLTNGTFTPYFTGNVEVVVIGGGGGGGGSYVSGCGCTGTGGGSGGVNVGPVSLPSTSPIAVTIGAGAVGSTVWCANNPNGGTGGTSSFGTYMVATGGPGGSSIGTGGPLGSPGGYAGGTASSCLSHGEIGPGGGGTAGPGGPNYGGPGGGGNGYGGAGGYISAGGFAGGGGSSGWSGLPGRNGANGIVVVKYLNRTVASPEPTFGSSGAEELNITAIELTLDKDTCLQPCSITAGVTWQSFGSSDITFRPAVLIDGITLAYAAIDKTISVGGTGSSLITTPTLSEGYHTICPYPN